MGDNALELDVYLKLHVDEIDESAFKGIEKAAKSAGSKIEKVFNFSKIAAGVALVVKSFEKLGSAIEKNISLTTKLTTSTITAFGRMLSSITQFSAKLSGIPTILKGISGAFSSITSSIRGAFASIDFIGLAKESVMLSSSLTEVKNVIDQVFGDGNKEIYNFASNAVEQLGMTTLAAEQFAGRFGAAMRSTGQSADATIKMSKALTQLTSDVASFYDIEQDVAAQKLFSGVISGMVKPMRELGVDMSVASLSAYALSRGISTAYKDMSAAEKQALRFEYALEKMSFVQGDYARTINSTANQIRLLKNQFKELGSIVGTIINAFFNPLIQILNRVVAAITNVVKAIASAMGIDWTLGSGAGVAGLSGVANSYDDVAESADDLAEAEDELGKATGKAAKEAKKALAPFHKLNVLQNKTADDSSKSGKGGLGGISDAIGGIADAAAGELPSIKDMIQGFLDWLWGVDWEGYLAKVLKALDDFFKKAPDAVQNFFDALQPWVERIAGLFMQIVDALNDTLGYNIGRTISEIFEGIARSINTFYDNINSIDVGSAIANILNGLVDNVDMFKEVFKLIGNSIESGFEMLKGFSEGFHWATLGENIYIGLKEGVKEINPDVIYDAIYSTLTGITETLNTFFENFNNDEELKQKIADSILAVIRAGSEYLKNGGFKELVTNIADFIVWVLGELTTELDKEENKKAVAEAIETLLENGAKILNAGDDLAKVIWEYVSNAIKQFFLSKDIPIWFKIVAAKKAFDVTGLTDAIESAIMGNLAIKLFTGKTGFGWLVTGISNAFKAIGKAVADSGLGSAVSGGLSSLSTVISNIGSACAAAAPYIAAFAAILAEFFLGEAGVQKLLGYDIEGSTFAEKWKSFWGNFAEITTNAWNNTVSLFTEVIPGVISGLATAAGVGLDLLGQTIATKLSELGAAIAEYFTPVREGFETAFAFLVGVAATVWEDIKAIWSVASQWFVDSVWTPLVSTAQGIISSISTFFSQLWATIQGIWSTVAAWFINTVWTPLTSAANQLYNDISNFFNQLWADIQSIWSAVADWFNTSVWIPLTTAVTTLKESIVTFFTEAWEGVKQIWDTVVSWFENSVWSPLTKAIDTVKKAIVEGFGDAVDTVKEKWEGFLDFFEGLYNKIKGWLDDLISKAKEWASSMVSKGASILSGSSSSSGVRGYANGGVFLPNKPQLAILGDNKSQTEYALTTGHLQQIADMMANTIGSIVTGSDQPITIPIYLGNELIDQRVITAGQMHNYRSNGR